MKLCSHCARIQGVVPVENRTWPLPDITLDARKHVEGLPEPHRASIGRGRR